MRFGTRLMLTYSLLIAVLTLAAGIVFGQYSIHRVEETAERDLRVLCENLSRQLDETVRPMEFITEFLLSDSTTRDSMTLLASVQRTELNSNHVNRAKISIKGSLITYCIDENFHRVNVFSESGDFLSSNFLADTVRDGYADPEDLAGIRRVRAALGRPVLLPPHEDNWDGKAPQTVFSLARIVNGGHSPCYIEVQKPYSAIESIYTIESGSHIHAAAVSQLGEVFFSELTQEQTAHLVEGIISEEPQLASVMSHLDGSVAAVQHSPYTGIYTVVVQSPESLSAATSGITVMTLLIALLIFGISIVFISVTSRRLSAPIRQLTAQMEQTDLENLDTDVVLARPSDEIEMLNTSYNHLMRRLNQSVSREKRLSTLQIQAELDALQAQVDPHFLYNVLNVISHRGVLVGDEAICDICENLAAMLRYSTGTSQRMVTLREELEHVEHYLYLLKTRYRDKLCCDIQVDPSILDQLLPKIVLQQIVENSINHGFRDQIGQMHIAIRGGFTDTGWYVQVRDNGGGFTAEALADLGRRMEEIRMTADSQDQRMELDIGGLGLINAYARMVLLFGDTAVFALENNPDGGACVTLGAARAVEVNL